MIARHLLAVVAFGAVLGVAAGCSDQADALDRAATQRAVGRSVAEQVEPNVTATMCPATIERARGGRFRCEVRLADDAGTVRAAVRQVDDEGRLEVRLLDAVVSAEQVAATLRGTLREEFARSFQVDCGSGWEVRAPGATFTCRARDKTSRRTVEVTVEDAAGTLSFEVLSA